MKKSYLKHLLGVSIMAIGTASAVDLTISCGSTGTEFKFCKDNAEAWAKKTGNNVKLYTAPTSTTDQLGLLRQLFAAGSSDLDVIAVDIVWPGVLANQLIDLKPYSNGAESQHFPAIVANNTVNGKLLGMPWFTDAGLLYYRKDLLEKYKLGVPQTWEELTKAAQTVQDGERKAGNRDMQGFVFQAKAYEGLTCDALEWIASYNGGTIVADNGQITINNAKAVKALETAADWIGKIAPTGVLNYGEEEARGVFQSGNAVFMRNWPYAWAAIQGTGSPVAGKVEVAPLPKGGADGRHAATLGGWQLAVPKYSKHPKEAAEFVMYLTSPEVQKYRAIKASYNPTVMALYKDPEVLKANPFFSSLYGVFTSAVPRPSTPTGAKYPQVSNDFWNAVHEVLSGKKKAEASLKALEGKLSQTRRGKEW